MIIDCIADLHGFYPKLHGGDLLIVAGDLTSRDEPEQHIEFSEWLDVQAYEKKIVIAGNHDNHIDPDSIECLRGCYYLEDSKAKFCDFKIWGSPWTLKFPGMNPACMTFTCDTEEELAKKWEMIPDDTDILITHSPAWGMKDGECAEQRLGSTSLLQRHVRTPLFNHMKLHVFGHIHEGYGKYDIRKAQRELGDKEGCVYVNASHVNKYYKPVNPPIRVIL